MINEDHRIISGIRICTVVTTLFAGNVFDQWVFHCREGRGFRKTITISFCKYLFLEMRWLNERLKSSKGFAWKILVGRGSLFRDCALLCTFAGLQNDHWPQDFKTFPFQFLIIVMQVVIALVVVFFIFNIPCDGPVLLFILLCLLQGDEINLKISKGKFFKLINDIRTNSQT